MRVFLSYRRGDTAGHAGRLTEVLERAFGADNVFQDLADITPGTDFSAVIDAAIHRCDALLALIGPGWLEARSAEGGRRLDDPADLVRVEIERALRRGLRVVPVLVGGAGVPAESELPPSLRALARLQAVELSDRRWTFDCEQLLQALRESGGKRQPRTRRAFLVAGGMIAAGGGLVGAVFVMRHRSPTALAGRWHLPTGSYWVVRVEADALLIDEVHYQSGEVWKRGTGRFSSPHLDYVLTYVFQPGESESGRLTLDDTGRTLHGTVVFARGGRRETITLLR